MRFLVYNATDISTEPKYSSFSSYHCHAGPLPIVFRCTFSQAIVCRMFNIRAQHSNCSAVTGRTQTQLNHASQHISTADSAEQEQRVARKYLILPTSFPHVSRVWKETSKPGNRPGCGLKLNQWNWVHCLLHWP